MKIFIVIAACLGACLVCLDASPAPHGGGGEGGRGGGPRGGGDGGHKPRGGSPKFSGTIYNYIVKVNANTTVNQTGFILNGTKTVFINTKDKSLNGTGINGSRIIHSCNNESFSFTLIIVSRPYGLCFVLNTSQACEALKARLDAINNTEVAAPETTYLTASETPLTAEERKTYRNASYACGQSPILPVAPTDANAPSTGTTTQLTVLDVDNLLRITYIKPPAVRKFPGGPRNGRPAPPPNKRQGGGQGGRGKFAGRN